MSDGGWSVVMGVTIFLMCIIRAHQHHVVVIIIIHINDGWCIQRGPVARTDAPRLLNSNNYRARSLGWTRERPRPIANLRRCYGAFNSSERGKQVAFSWDLSGTSSLISIVCCAVRGGGKSIGWLLFARSSSRCDLVTLDLSDRLELSFGAVRKAPCFVPGQKWLKCHTWWSTCEYTHSHAWWAFIVDLFEMGKYGFHFHVHSQCKYK